MLAVNAKHAPLDKSIQSAILLTSTACLDRSRSFAPHGDFLIVTSSVAALWFGISSAFAVALLVRIVHQKDRP